MKSSIYWDITPCSPVKVSRRFGENFASIFRVEVIFSSETLVNLQTTRRYIPEDRTLQFQCSPEVSIPMRGFGCFEHFANKMCCKNTVNTYRMASKRETICEKHGPGDAPPDAQVVKAVTFRRTRMEPVYVEHS
jgi:hypothetical protein